MSGVTNQNQFNILRRYVAGERDFNQINLVGINLTGAVLKAVNMEGANLAFSNLTRINLSDSNLVEIVLSQALLVNSNLRRSNLQRADLSETNLKQAFLEEANLKAANLQGADLDGAYLHKAILQGADLRGAKLTKTLAESAYYDDTTRFDRDFDPASVGMIKLGEKPQGDRQENLEHLSGNLAKDVQNLKSFLEKERNNSFLVNKISSLLKSKPQQEGNRD
jgi:hypothetical protein